MLILYTLTRKHRRYADDTQLLINGAQIDQLLKLRPRNVPQLN